MELIQGNAIHEAPRVGFRVLWRMRGPTRVVRAALWPQAVGHELVVGFEDDESNVIETQFDEVAIQALEERANALKAVLVAKGWTAATG